MPKNMKRKENSKRNNHKLAGRVAKGAGKPRSRAGSNSGSFWKKERYDPQVAKVNAIAWIVYSVEIAVIIETIILRVLL